MMNLSEFEKKVHLAFDILSDADIIEEFDDALFIRVDKAMWDELWGNATEEK
jgi:hypothetical protein